MIGSDSVRRLVGLKGGKGGILANEGLDGVYAILVSLRGWYKNAWIQIPALYQKGGLSFVQGIRIQSGDSVPVRYGAGCVFIVMAVKAEKGPEREHTDQDKNQELFKVFSEQMIQGTSPLRSVHAAYGSIVVEHQPPG